MISTAETGSADSTPRRIHSDRRRRPLGRRSVRPDGQTERIQRLDASARLALADAIRPQAIILDMRMPLINDIQFLRQVRARPQLVDIPVASGTGDYFLSDALQQELTTLGASLRFKPLWLEDLVALARTLTPR